MPSTTLSIVTSAASAVGKTFLIGAIGYCAVKFPKPNPLLPKKSINMLSRLSFSIFLLPLIYTGLASSVTLQSLSSLWLVVVASLVIIAISSFVATVLAYLPFFQIYKEEHFIALLVAISFPNIVAIPILIFPALCEYEVFHEFGNININNSDNDAMNNESSTSSSSSLSGSLSLQENIDICESEANAVVFAYFFGFSLLFWSFGDRSLRKLRDAQRNDTATNDTNHIYNISTDIDTSNSISTGAGTGTDNSTKRQIKRTNNQHQNQHQALGRRITSALLKGIVFIFEVMKDILLSPGFIILMLSFITACIQPLQDALFQPGGVLRVIGSTLESLSSAGATVATIIVAAALADDSNDDDDEDLNNDDDEVVPLTNESAGANYIPTNNNNDGLNANEVQDIPPIECNGDEEEENNNGNFNKNQGFIICEKDDESNENDRSIVNNLNNNESTTHTSILDKANIHLRQIMKHPSFKVQVWHVISRLLVTPAVVFGILLQLDCSFNISPIAKLVLLINSALPGALIVVVILKAHGLTKAASIVSQTYLPSYTISVVTIAAWSSVGMIAFDSDSDVCE